MLLVWLSVYLVFNHFDFIIACDVKNGPAGQTKCVKLSGYKDYQWATCLTDSYIKQRSAYTHRCINTNALYCWYQCEVEMFGSNRGSVTPVCQCSPYKFVATPKPLYNWCYSPTGDSCNWYKDCLDNLYNCQGTDAEYTIKYATYFCNAYEENYNKLSNSSRIWANSVRSCLQVSLVPLLRKFITEINCNNIQSTARRVYQCCYLGGKECSTTNSISICDLPVDDWMHMALSIHERFSGIEVSALSLATIPGALRQCTQGNIVKLAERADVAVIAFVYQWQGGPGIDGNAFVDQLSKELSWDRSKLYWFYLSSDRFFLNEKSKVKIKIVLGDTEAFRFNLSSAQYLEKGLLDLKKNIESSDLPYKLATKNNNVLVETMNVCADFLCKTIKSSVDVIVPCGWYKSAIAKQDHCKTTDAKYAVTYATYLCEASNSTSLNSSSVPNEWGDSLRKCLQFSLVPLLLGPSTSLNCGTLKTKAFSSYKCCYSAEESCSSTTKSICGTSINDWMYIISTIHNLVDGTKHSSSEYNRDIPSILVECTPIYQNKIAEKVYLEIMEFVFDFQPFPDVKTIGFNFIDQMATKFSWDRSKLYWWYLSSEKVFIYGIPKIKLIMLLGDSIALQFNLSTASLLENVVSHLKQSVKSSDFYFQRPTTGENILVETVTVCVDFKCRKKKSSVNAEVPCDWYKNTLERSYTCENTPADYSIKYATYLCRAHNYSSYNFSSAGKKWIGSVQRCLQSTLVSLLQQTESDTVCNTIYHKSLDSYQCCTLRGIKCSSMESICEIPVEDWMYVTSIVHESFDQTIFSSSAYRVISSVVTKCTDNYLNGIAEKPYFKILEFVYDMQSLVDFKSIAIDFIDQTAKQLSWDRSKLYWFYLSSNRISINGRSKMKLKVVLSDRVASQYKQNASLYLENVVAVLKERVKSSTLVYQRSSSYVDYILETFNVCGDVQCNKITSFVDVVVPCKWYKVGMCRIVIFAETEYSAE